MRGKIVAVAARQSKRILDFRLPRVARHVNLGSMKFVLPIIVLAATASLMAAEPLKMNPVPAETLDYASNKGNKYRLRYFYGHPGGAHTNAGAGSARLLVQTMASYLGDKTANDDYVEQIKFLLDGPNTISGSGGYPAQHEHVMLASLFVARETPSIWERFSDEEKKKIDLLMKAHLVGSAYTTSDKTYEVKDNIKTLTGDRNMHRDWNPNYQEGMTGGLILGACWFGPKEAQAFLDNYDHAKFREELKAAGLSNTYDVYNWKIRHPDSNAPDDETINASVRGFRFKGRDITKPMDFFVDLAATTYGANVTAGLNKGEGLNGGGKLVKNADKVANIGKKGMLLEFGSMDANGPRSCAHYAYDGMRPNLAKQVAMLVSGHFDYNHPKWKEVFEQIKIGNEDLFFKLEQGYVSYAKGRVGAQPMTFGENDERSSRDLWEKVILPYHESQTK